MTDSEALRSEMATFFASGVPIDKFIPAWESWKRKQMAKQNAALAGKDPAHIERWRQGLAEKRSLFGGGIQGPAGKLADQPPPPGVTIGGQ